MSQYEKEHVSGNESNDEEPDWRAVGAGAGFAIGGPVGGAAGAAITAWLSSVEESESPHNQALATAAKNVREHASEYGSLYIAHVDADDVGRDLEDENPGGIVSEIDGDPDLLYIDVMGPRANLVAEVETAKSLRTQTDHTLDQLERYRATGFKRMLAMPEGEVETAREWVQDHDDRLTGLLHICSAADVATHF